MKIRSKKQTTAKVLKILVKQEDEDRRDRGTRGVRDPRTGDLDGGAEFEGGIKREDMENSGLDEDKDQSSGSNHSDISSSRSLCIWMGFLLVYSVYTESETTVLKESNEPLKYNCFKVAPLSHCGERSRQH